MVLNGKYAVVALSCGGREPEMNRRENRPENWDPTDEAIARHAAEVAVRHFAPIFAQWEVADLLPGWARKYLRGRIGEHRKGPKRRLDTMEVLEQIKALLEKERYEMIILVAHPIHMPRVEKWAARIFGSGKVISRPAHDAPLDPRSKWPWVCSPMRFRMYERCVAGPIDTLRRALWKPAE